MHIRRSEEEKIVSVRIILQALPLRHRTNTVGFVEREVLGSATEVVVIPTVLVHHFDSSINRTPLNAKCAATSY